MALVRNRRDRNKDDRQEEEEEEDDRRFSDTTRGHREEDDEDPIPERPPRTTNVITTRKATEPPPTTSSISSTTRQVLWSTGQKPPHTHNTHIVRPNPSTISSMPPATTRLSSSTVYQSTTLEGASGFSKQTSTSVMAAIIGATSAALILVIIISTVAICYYRRKLKGNNSRTPLKESPSQNSVNNIPALHGRVNTYVQGLNDGTYNPPYDYNSPKNGTITRPYEGVNVGEYNEHAYLRPITSTDTGYSSISGSQRSGYLRPIRSIDTGYSSVSEYSSRSPSIQSDIKDGVRSEDEEIYHYIDPVDVGPVPYANFNRENDPEYRGVNAANVHGEEGANETPEANESPNANETPPDLPAVRPDNNTSLSNEDDSGNPYLELIG